MVSGFNRYAVSRSKLWDLLVRVARDMDGALNDVSGQPVNGPRKATIYGWSVTPGPPALDTRDHVFGP